MRNAILMIVAALALTLAGCAKNTQTSQSTTTSEATAAGAEASTPGSEATTATSEGGTTYTVSLRALNGSHESGTATITDVGNPAGIHTSTINLTLTNAPSGVKQAVNIFKGSCPPTTMPSIFLEPAVNGKMSHELGGIGIADLSGSAIAVWSTEDPTTGKYISCGEIHAK